MHRIHAAALPAVVLIASCAATPTTAPPVTPAALRPPAGQVLQLEALATGAQVYECTRKADATYEWAFKAPEATLVSRSARPLGRHYAGPTWESADGSTVVGEVDARDAGPDPAAIPWLLLASKKNTGAGPVKRSKTPRRCDSPGENPPDQENDYGQGRRTA